MGPAFTEKNVVVSSAPGTSPCMILGDHSELEQLFLNLLMNAHEATPPDGMVRIELVVRADHATVAVVDTGSGIPAESWNACSDPFFTTKERARGSGWRSAPRSPSDTAPGFGPPTGGRGAAFTVDFPLAGDGAGVGVNTVLIVTPDDALRGRLVAALGGHSVFVAQSDSEALKTLRLIDIDVILRGGGLPGASRRSSPA